MQSDKIDKIISDRIVGGFKELIPEFSATLGAAVGTWLQKKATIAIARDFRTDSRMMKRAFTAGLMSSGVSSIDFHAVPTPLLQFYVRRFGADGGVMFTSGHYEGERTGIRIFNETGAELTEQRLGEIRQILSENKVRRVPPHEMTDISEAMGAIDVYIAAIRNLFDRALIRGKHFKIVVDCALGPTSLVLPEMLSQMAVEVIAINSFNPKHVTKNLPNAVSLLSLARTVKANKADFGVAFDVEGSRVTVCDENGNLRTSDAVTVGLAARAMERSRGRIIVSESTTASLDATVEGFGGEHEVHRVRDLPGTIAGCIRARQGIFGGSDAGAYWTPSFTVDSDGIYTTLQILETLAQKGVTLSSYLQSLPQVPAAHREVSVKNGEDPGLFVHLENFRDYEEDVNCQYVVDTLSGVKIVFKNGWVNVGPGSNDLNTLHLICEARPFSLAKSLLDAVQHRITVYDEEKRSTD